MSKKKLPSEGTTKTLYYNETSMRQNPIIQIEFFRFKVL